MYFLCIRAFFLFLYSRWTADGRSSRAVISTVGRAGRASVVSLMACISSKGQTGLHRSPSGDAAPPVHLEAKSLASLCHLLLCSLKVISRKRWGFNPNLTFAQGPSFCFKTFPQGKKGETLWHFNNLLANLGLKQEIPLLGSSLTQPFTTECYNTRSE